MRKLLCKLWEDDGGFIISLELLFLAVILVIGLLAGLGNLRVAMITSLTALANAVLAINFAYTIDGIDGHSAGSHGTDLDAGTLNVFNGYPEGPQNAFRGPTYEYTGDINPGLYNVVP